MTDTVKISNYIFHEKLENVVGKRLFAKPRFSSKGFYGKLILHDNDIYFKYEEKNAQNAKGQHLVLFYNMKLIGGGVIE